MRHGFGHWLTRFVLIVAPTAALAQGDRVPQPAPFEKRIINVGGNECIAGELLIQLRSVRDGQGLQALHTALKCRLLGRLWRGRIHHIALPQGLTIPVAIRRYAVSRFVRYVEPNYVTHLDPPIPAKLSDVRGPTVRLMGANDPYANAGSLWGMFKIQADQAWDRSTGSPDVVVAVVDTSIDYTHPDLIANMWHNPGEVPGNAVDDDGNGYLDDVYGIDAFNNTGDPAPPDFHGTHVAGTVAAVGNNGIGVAGVCWRAKIMSVKIFHGASTTSAAVVRAFSYVLDMKARGVGIRACQNSWGGGSSSQIQQDLISAGGEAGILFAFAAGNNGANNDTTPSYPASYTLANILAVAATDSNDNLASFSNYGATSVDVAAPGVSILSCWPVIASSTNDRYNSISGTSMATPHVSGLAALLLSVNPSLTVAQLKSAIMDNTDTVPALSGKVVTGGRINAKKALDAVAGSGGPTVTSITPNSAANTGTVDVTNLAGTNFQSDVAVKLTRSGYSDIAGTNVTRVSASQLTCKLDLTGAAAGIWDVKVINPDGISGMLANAFEVTGGAVVPSVTGITPSSGINKGFLDVTVSGTNFVSGASVRLTRGGQPDLSATNVLVTNSGQICCRLNLEGKEAGAWNVVVVNNPGTGNERSATLDNGFSVLIPNVLLVDDDGGEVYENLYHAALSAAGKVIYRWDAANQGAVSLATLQDFDDVGEVVVWFTGDTYSNTLTAADQSNLQSFLDGGGRLFLTGQDIGYDIGATGFYANYLRAIYRQDDVELYGMSGTAGDPIGNGLVLRMGGDGLLYSYYPSEVDPSTNAVKFLAYDSSVTSPLAAAGLSSPSRAVPKTKTRRSRGAVIAEVAGTGQGSGDGDRPLAITGTGSAGIRVDTGAYRLVYLAFSFDTLNSATTRAVLMSRILNWLTSNTDTTPPTFSGITSVVSGPLGITLSWSAASDPNPVITYQIYQATSGGGQSFASPSYVTTKTSYSITSDLKQGQTYYFVVRATDGSGNQDSNAAELSGTPSRVLQTTVGSVDPNFVPWMGNARGRGNLYAASSTTRLVEQQILLALIASTELHFVVYESATQSGTYSRVSDKTVNAAANGAAYYSSGPIDVTLTAGRYYQIGACWNSTGNVHYYGGGTHPVSVPFGESKYGFSVTSYPPPATLSAGTSSNVYAQRLMTDSNHCPALDWTGETGYTSDGVNPDSGDRSTNFIFRVKYTDLDDDAPSYVRLHVKKGGTSIPDSPFSMDSTGDTTYTDGSIYTKAITGLTVGTDYTYYFTATDGSCDATGPPTEAKDGPTLNQTLSLTIDRGWDLGVVDKNSIRIMTAGEKITVTNDGDGFETFTLRVTAPTGWTAGSAPGDETFLLQALFAGTADAAPAQSSYQADDIVTTSSQAATAALFGFTGSSGNGVNVAAAASRALFFLFGAPTETTYPTQRTIVVTIGAQAP